MDDMTPLANSYSGRQGLALLEGLDERGKLVFTVAEALDAGATRSLTAKQVYHVLLSTRGRGLDSKDQAWSLRGDG